MDGITDVKLEADGHQIPASTHGMKSNSEFHGTEGSEISSSDSDPQKQKVVSPVDVHNYYSLLNEVPCPNL